MKPSSRKRFDGILNMLTEQLRLQRLTDLTTHQLDHYAWFRDNSDKKTHPVGQKMSNAWGLYDMHGNVWEWCGDWYGDYPTSSVTDPTGPQRGSIRVFRGGSWIYPAESCRSAFRLWYLPSYRSSHRGFRVTCVPSGQ